MVQVIPVILTFHTHGTGISAGIISDLYRDYICSVERRTVTGKNVCLAHEQQAFKYQSLQIQDPLVVDANMILRKNLKSPLNFYAFRRT